MAFLKNDFAKTSSSLNNFVPRIWSYRSATDTLALTKTSGYFGDVINEITPADLIYVRATDGEFLYKFDHSGTGTIVSSDDRLTSVTSSMSFSGAAEESKYFPYFGNSVPLAAVLTLNTAATGDYFINLEIDSTVLWNASFLNTDPAGKVISFVFLNAGAIGANKTARWIKLNTSSSNAVEIEGWVVSRLTDSSTI